MQSSNAVEKMFYRSVHQKKNVGIIINKILDEHYPGEARNITFDELLGWDMWQTFIKILSK